jgi:Tfp pilus assembly protein PilN
MTVTLNIGNQDIRLVSQKANHIEHCVKFDVPPGMIKDGLILDMPGVAALLKEQFRVQKISSGQVAVCLTGLSFIYRVLTLPALKSLKLRTAVERATQKEINLPIEDLYLDWQIISQKDHEIKVFVMGIARTMVDALLNTMKLAGFGLQALELKALALTRAAGHQEALVVDCESDAFEILVISDGIPVTIHRVSPKNEMSTLDDNLNQVIAELNRTIDYYNLNNPDHPLTQSTPVMLSGSLCDDAPTRELILTSIGHSVQFFKPQMSVSADFLVSTFAANLGLLYKANSYSSLQPAAARLRTESGIDLIKARKRALKHPLQIKQIIVSAAIIGALVLFVPIWVLRHQAVTESANLKFKADNLYLVLVEANQKFELATSTQNKISDFTLEAETLQKERLMMTGKGDISLILRTISDQLPSQAVFTEISFEPEKITIDGVALYRQDVVQYIHNLEKQGLFSEVRIAMINTGAAEENSGNTFRIIIER